MLEQYLYEITYNKKGLETGGPSDIGIGVYICADIVDNVIFSKNTIWSNHETNEYKFYENKIGKVIISDAINIPIINNETYDFVFSCHLLEHIANPLKAIKEWLRIIKKDGYIIIVVPEKSLCFDHKRDYSNFSTLLEQYKKNVGEDDLSTLKEVLMNHDLSLDKNAGTFLEFTKRCLDNFNNRCMHHYVYSDDLLLEICNYLNCLYIYHETRGINRWFIIKKK
jgi:SAM-dependent methyltransferase